MMRRNKLLFWILFVLSVFFVASACGLISKIVNTAEKGKTAAETIQAMATSAEDIIGQVEEIATEVGSSGMLQTAQVMVTQFADSGILSTLQAAVTDMPDNMGNIQATVQAGMENFQQSEPPQDIPIVPGQVDSLMTSQDLINYLTPLPYRDVVDFYMKEMPANGWEKSDDGIIMEENCMLFFEKDDRQVMIAIISGDEGGKTQVTITQN